MLGQLSCYLIVRNIFCNLLFHRKTHRIAVKKVKKIATCLGGSRAWCMSRVYEKNFEWSYRLDG